MIAKRLYEFAGAGVDRVKNIIGCKEEATVAAILTLPISQSALADHVRLTIVVNPYLMAGRSVEGYNIIILSNHVHHAAYDDWTTFEPVSAGRRIKPDLLQLLYIRLVYLLQCRVLIRVQSPFVSVPRGV